MHDDILEDDAAGASEFDQAFQDKISILALRDNLFAQRTEGLLSPKYFDNEANAFLIDFANRHFDKYKQVPSLEIIANEVRQGKAAKRLKDDFIDEIKVRLRAVYSPTADMTNREWSIDRVSDFVRQRAVESAIEASIDTLDKKGDISLIYGLFEKARSVGSSEGSGAVSYSENLKARVAQRAAALSGGVLRNSVTTGHRELDELLYHKGWGRKEMAILMGGAKSGKSTALQHFAIQAWKAGKNCLYVTLENSKEVTQDRMDAAVAGIPMKDLDTAALAIENAVMAFDGKGGRLDIHEFPGGACKVSDLRRIIQKAKAQGIIYDILVVDYADEMAPEKAASEKRYEFHAIYQGLRGLGIEENMAILTATQTNRAGNKAATATATDVSEDFNKVRLADVLITINATDEEKKSGQLRLYFAAMRNSESGLTVTCMSDRARQRFITKILTVS